MLTRRHCHIHSDTIYLTELKIWQMIRHDLHIIRAYHIGCSEIDHICDTELNRLKVNITRIVCIPVLCRYVRIGVDQPPYTYIPSRTVVNRTRKRYVFTIYIFLNPNLNHQLKRICRRVRASSRHHPYLATIYTFLLCRRYSHLHR